MAVAAVASHTDAAALRQVGTYAPATRTLSLTDREALVDWLHQADPAGSQPDLEVELAGLEVELAGLEVELAGLPTHG